MKWMLAVAVCLLSGALFAQNTSPTIQVTALGGMNVAHGSTIPVSQSFTLNGVGITYFVDDAEGDPVSIGASVTNLAQAGNWGAANFTHPSTPTPYQHQVQAGNGLFGPVGTKYNVTLTLLDGVGGSTTFGFTMEVTNTGGTPGGGDSGGGGGGGCAIGAPLAPWAAFGMGLIALWARRRR